MIDKQHTGSSSSAGSAYGGLSLYGDYARTETAYAPRRTPSLMVSVDSHAAPSTMSEPPVYTQISAHVAATENPFQSPHDQTHRHASAGSRSTSSILISSSSPVISAPVSSTLVEDVPVVKPEEEEEPQAEVKGKKKRKLHPLVKGLAVLTVGCPVAILVAAGALIWGTGQILVGVGDLMTGGPLKETAKKAWDQRKVARRAECNH